MNINNNIESDPQTQAIVLQNPNPLDVRPSSEQSHNSHSRNSTQHSDKLQKKPHKVIIEPEENGNQPNEKKTKVKVPMTRKKKIIIAAVVSITLIIIGLGAYFGYNLYVYGSLLPQSFSVYDPVFNGYDVVEYHSLGADDDGVKGNEEYQVEFDNAYFWFKNEENKEKFEENPQKYAPQIGGFCTWGLQNGGGAPWGRDWLGPPCDAVNGWTVFKGQLYCNFSKSLAEEFFEEGKAEANLKEVEDMWIGWFGSLDAKAGYFNNRCYSNNSRFCQIKQQDFGQGNY